MTGLTDARVVVMTVCGLVAVKIAGENCIA